MDHRIQLSEKVVTKLRAFALTTTDEAVQTLVATLVAAPENFGQKNSVLAEFKKTLKACKAYAPADREALVTSLESILDLLHIESSDGLLNEWLLGVSL